jgi:hypothetical protein
VYQSFLDIMSTHCKEVSVEFINSHCIVVAVCTGVGQNNGSTEKLRNRICVGYAERTSDGNTGCSSVSLHSVMLVSVH